MLRCLSVRYCAGLGLNLLFLVRLATCFVVYLDCWFREGWCNIVCVLLILVVGVCGAFRDFGGVVCFSVLSG